MQYLKHGSWFGVFHRVMDARGKLGDQDKIQIYYQKVSINEKASFIARYPVELSH